MPTVCCSETEAGKHRDAHRGVQKFKRGTARSEDAVGGDVVEDCFEIARARIANDDQGGKTRIGIIERVAHLLRQRGVCRKRKSPMQSAHPRVNLRKMIPKFSSFRVQYSQMSTDWKQPCFI